MPRDYDNSNSGALVKNAKKTAPKHPDWKGGGEVAGVEYWISAWIKEDKNGKKYMSLSAQEKGEKGDWNNPNLRTWSGCLFKNDQKKDNAENDYYGSTFEDNEDAEKTTIKAWNLKKQDGTPYLKLTFEPPVNTETDEPVSVADFDDDVPF